jgi:hypothetical protein
MRFLPTRVHGLLDYVVSAFVMLLPWLGGFARGGTETLVPVALGAASIVYSLFTDYELGVWRRLPMRMHLILDTAQASVLTFSPALFGFADIVNWPFPLIALAELGVVLTSRTEPARRHATA